LSGKSLQKYHSAESIAFPIPRLLRQKDHERRMVKFRFQDPKIWKLAIEIANGLCDVADELEEKRFLLQILLLRLQILKQIFYSPMKDNCCVTYIKLLRCCGYWHSSCCREWKGKDAN
jgi:hypothetical protein